MTTDDTGAIDRGGAWALVGAGPHGLSALKNLLQLGLDADGYERDTDLGGNWNFHAENSRVYESTHLISTKPFTQFPDFPMPDAYPDYPSHWQVHRYFRSYAEHFGLLDHLSFNTEVVIVVPAASGERWDVTVRNRDTGEEVTRQYAGVVIANGHNWWPKIPTYPGQDTFTGEILHSANYKTADAVRGKRVLVVGAGNTGCDVAVESAQNAKATYHSTRRGYYYNPKYAFGRPSDQTADLLLAMRLPLALRRDVRLAASHAVHTSAEVVTRLYTLAGGNAVFAASPLQRALRNVQVATQHMMVGEASFELAGRLLLGVPTPTAQL